MTYFFARQRLLPLPEILPPICQSEVALTDRVGPKGTIKIDVFQLVFM